MNNPEGIIQEYVQPLLQGGREFGGLEHMSERFVVRMDHEVAATPHIVMEFPQAVNHPKEFFLVGWPPAPAGREFLAADGYDVGGSDVFLCREGLEQNTADTSLGSIRCNVEWTREIWIGKHSGAAESLLQHSEGVQHLGSPFKRGKLLRCLQGCGDICIVTNVFPEESAEAEEGL
jgi:hypothetical protein